MAPPMSEAEVDVAFAEIDRLLARGGSLLAWGRVLARAAMAINIAAIVVWLVDRVIDEAALERAFWAMESVVYLSFAVGWVMHKIHGRNGDRIDGWLDAVRDEFDRRIALTNEKLRRGQR